MKTLKILFGLLVAGAGVFLCLSLYGVRASYSGKATPTFMDAQVLAVGASGTPTARPSETAVPSATVDFQSTAVIAQQTADEARRVNAEITAEFEQRLFEQVQVTAAYEARVQEVYSWTQQAASTSIPLTATQQSVLNTQIPAQQAFAAAEWTASAQAPTQAALMLTTEQRAKWGWMGYVFQFAIGVFLVGIVVYMFRFPPTRREVVEREEPAETVVWMKNTRDRGATSKRSVIPCSPDQLTEFAIGVTQLKKTLSINSWEGSDTLWNREAIIAMREWLEESGLAVPLDNGQLAKTDDLIDFLTGWLERRSLPSGFDIVHPEEEMDRRVGEFVYMS